MEHCRTPNIGFCSTGTNALQVENKNTQTDVQQYEGDTNKVDRSTQTYTTADGHHISERKSQAKSRNVKYKKISESRTSEIARKNEKERRKELGFQHLPSVSIKDTRSKEEKDEYNSIHIARDEKRGRKGKESGREKIIARQIQENKERQDMLILIEESGSECRELEQN